MKNKIIFGDKEYELKFSMEAFTVLENEWNMNLSEVMQRLIEMAGAETGESEVPKEKRMKAADIPVLVYAGLSGSYKELTLKKTKELVKKEDAFMRIWMEVISALTKGMGTEKKDEAKKEKN